MVDTRYPVSTWVVLAVCTTVVGLSVAVEPQELFSPLTAETFQAMAHETYTAPDADQARVAQAVVVLEAAIRLERRSDYLVEDLLRACAKSKRLDFANTAFTVLGQYATLPRADLEVARETVDYLLETSDSRQRREEILAALLVAVAEANPLLRSDLETRLAFLAAERADDETASTYLLSAYEKNPYNQTTFEKLQDVAGRMGQSVRPQMLVRHWRLAIQLDPLSLRAALTLARAAEQQGLYDVAAEAYRYAADVFAFLYPDQPLPPSIYIPWALSCYNAPRRRDQSLQIAARVRQTGRFDLVLEGIAAAVAAKLDDEARRQQLLQAGPRAEQRLLETPASAEVSPVELAWFYGFVDENPEKALAWANRAYQADPNDPANKAIFAYALVLNGQSDLAQKYLDTGLPGQIAAVAEGRVLLAQDKKTEAVARLKEAVAMDVTSLVADKARQLLAVQGSPYVSTLTPEPIRTALAQEFGERLMPTFVPPTRRIQARLTFEGSELAYGDHPLAQFIILNLSDESMLIGPDALFQGRIRVDVEVTGDLTARFDSLVERTIRPAQIIAPHQHATSSLWLITGPLRRLLDSHPQASVQITFTVHLDPIVDAAGRAYTGIPGLEPVRLTVSRRGIDLTQSLLLQRLDALSHGMEGQKVRAVRLFAGLLDEQGILAAGGATYRYRVVDRTVLVDALRRGLADDNWKVRLMTMAAIAAGQRPIDYQLLAATSRNLRHDQWPVRVAALWVLNHARGTGFEKVLDWTAQQDAHPVVRALAVAMGGKEPEQIDQADGAGVGTVDTGRTLTPAGP